MSVTAGRSSGSSDMDRAVAHLANALRRFRLASPAWPRSEVLARAEAGAQALLNILTDELVPDLRVSARGRFGRAYTAIQWRRKFYYAQRKLKFLQQKESQLRSGRFLGKRWIVTAGLSDPRASVRSVAAWCRDFAVDEHFPVSYGSVSQVRDAFGEILLKINRQDMASYADGLTDGFLLVRHLHDEATMRLRSDLPAVPAAAGAFRGRSSKIQNSVVTLHRNVADAALPVLVELQPLGRKDAPTMATALRAVIDTVVAAVGASQQARSARIIHCLVGDGIFTNAAAAQLLWSWASAAPVAPQYRLLVFTCSTHAANLVVRSAITQDEHTRTGDVDSHPLVATCVRFFKYLMPEYASEFVKNLRAHVDSTLQVLPKAPGAATLKQWDGLQELYGKGVIPDRLRALLNGDPGTLEHWCGGRSSGSVADQGRDALVSEITLELERSCLRSEERPVTTRFWLFEGCVQTLFRWKLFNLPAADVLQTGVKKHRATSHKRIMRVRGYLEAPGTHFQLAVACVCLRLTSLVTSITGQKNRGRSSGSPETGHEDRHPLLVRLARGDVSARASAELGSIFKALHHDATLTPRLGKVITRLLTTAAHVLLRFSQYAAYPTRVVLMAQKYNPDGYYQEVLRFLYTDERLLDTGYSLPLRREAWVGGRSSGSAASSSSSPSGAQADAIQHLLSPHVQEELATIAMAIETSTLDVERKHNYDRRSEAPRVTSVAKASRDAFVRHWRTEARKAVPGPTQKPGRFMSARAVAMEQCPELFPQAKGKLKWESRKKKKQRRLRHGRPSGSTAYADLMEERGPEFRHEARLRRACARVEAASSVVSWPRTTVSWVDWLEREEKTYDEAIQAVRAGARRAINVRVVASPHVPQKDPAVRVQPKTKATLPAWAPKLSDGWFALRLGTSRIVIFAARCAGYMAAFVPPETPGRGFAVPASLRLDTVLGLLEDVLPAKYYHPDVEVLRLVVACEHKDNCFWIQPFQAIPALPSRGVPRHAADEEDSASAGRSSGSDADCGKVSDLSASDKEKLSLCSTDDSAAEVEPEHSEDKNDADAEASDSDDSHMRGPRAAAHTHTAWQNDHFCVDGQPEFLRRPNAHPGPLDG